MPLFRVTLFIKSRVDDSNRDIEVEAENEQRAAENVAGEKLLERGKPSDYRAQVMPMPFYGKRMKSFFSQPEI
jgi:hypothetical protein|tara:strand:- start:10 stop:228 length:219 start_codon:yes stop_codon:yes gene_type:complete